MTTSLLSAAEKKALEEFEWLKDHPEFEERPASILEFMTEDYLNIEGLVRPGILEALVEIFGTEVDGKIISKKRRAMVTGGIGIGKTTFASIALPYMAHWVLCLKNPQKFYGLLPGSRIAFMQMSTSESQAKQVLFGDIDARMKHSKWFVDNYPRDPVYKSQIRLPKDIWILPGDSQETTFEGYNILGGILDEMDSHQVTKLKDYAEVGYDTISNRITSRFQERGLIIVIGQMKKGNGFAAKKYEELKKDSDALVVRMTIWDSFGWKNYLKPDGTHDSFFYDIARKQIVPSEIAKALDSKNIMEIPNVYLKDFQNNPEKALRDQAGIPPKTGDPFISLTHRISEAQDRWKENHAVKEPAFPVNEAVVRPHFHRDFHAADPLKRVMHIDLAYSAEGDALGMAMGHVKELIHIDGEDKPYIVFDFLMRMKATPGTEIMLSDVRRVIYDLRDEYRFKLKKVTMDGFESTDTLQQLSKRRFETEKLSCDKSKLPYEDLREALYEGRVEFPEYMTYINLGDVNTVNIAFKELSELSDDGKKIDHPEGGSKDVADAMAAVCTTLMSDTTYRRGLRSLAGPRSTSSGQLTGSGPQGYGGYTNPAALGLLEGIQAPLPPTGDERLGIGLTAPLPPMH